MAQDPKYPKVLLQERRGPIKHRFYELARMELSVVLVNLIPLVKTLEQVLNAYQLAQGQVLVLVWKVLMCFDVVSSSVSGSDRLADPQERSTSEIRLYYLGQLMIWWPVEAPILSC